MRGKGGRPMAILCTGALGPSTRGLWQRASAPVFGEGDAADAALVAIKLGHVLRRGKESVGVSAVMAGGAAPKGALPQAGRRVC